MTHRLESVNNKFVGADIREFNSGIWNSRIRECDFLASRRARHQYCFLAADRDHLLGIIEAGFGSFEEFNVRVRSLIADRMGINEQKQTDPVQ